MFTSFDIPVPRVKWKYVDGEDFFLFMVIMALLATVILGILWGIQSVKHRPKFVTKTVTSYATPLSQAQQIYVKDCEESRNNSRDHGVPNAGGAAADWSCTYADK